MTKPTLLFVCTHNTAAAKRQSHTARQSARADATG